MTLLRQNIDGAQTFFIDPKIADGSRTVAISSVDLFFKFKPDSRNNITGQPSPGVTVFIVPTKFGVPIINRSSGIFTDIGITSVDIQDIITSSDASQPTKFEFPDPFPVVTDAEYALVYSFDLSSQFELWKTVSGEPLINNPNRRSPGPSNRFIGNHYGFTSMFIAEQDDSNLDDYMRFWRNIPSSALKFNINVARYAINGVPIQETNTTSKVFNSYAGLAPPAASNSSTLTYDMLVSGYEYVTFSENESSKAEFVGAQLAYQNTFFFPGGTANSDALNLTIQRGNTTILANSEYPNGSAFAWTDIFSANNPNKYITIKPLDNSKTNVRLVKDIITNTQIELYEAPSFTSNTGRMLITPTALVSSFNKSSLFDKEDAFVFLSHSTANSTVRFVNNTIEAATIVAGGSGYSNGDVLYLTGFEDVNTAVEGGYVAAANLVTNSTGGITDLFFTNAGCGFVNTDLIVPVFANSTQVGNTSANSSAGTGANISYTVGATINTEYGNNVFKNSVIQNIDFGDFLPFYKIDVPPGVNYNLSFHSNYYKTPNANTNSGYAYYVRDTATNRPLRLSRLNRTQQYGLAPVLVSKSNEFVIKYPNGSDNNRIPNTATTYSNSIFVRAVFDYVSDYSSFDTSTPYFQFSKFIVNDDATDEHTDSGNAFSKHISTVLNFERPAEDFRLYLTAYKPANTDIKAYARFYKVEDTESFDDKNWTELEPLDGDQLVSSSIDEDDYKEFTYGIYNIPKDRTKLSGTVTLANNSATITGVGTNFSANLANGDVVYIYQPLFPNNYVIASVVSIANTTSMVIDESTTNNSLLSDGMKIEKITYPKQAFLNPLNSNIVRYYNSNYESFDTYDSIAVKLVYLSDTLNKAPRVDDLRGVGISA